MLFAINPSTIQFVIKFVQYTYLALNIYKLSKGQMLFKSRMQKITLHVFLGIQVVQILLVIIRMIRLYYS